MTQEEKRIKIAETQGWTFEPHYDSKFTWRHRESKTVAYPSDIPDYFNSLDAMHEAEKTLFKGHEDDLGGCDLLSDYVFNLIIECEAYLSCHATAAQRAEAYGKTLNLW